ncbi:sulfatase/phosphatase domain-containing protein [Congregibacter sp.]|uniref:sulfatase/phosphatase domain-containing protein n=1 Tax=Congregibacter sp. TaxID=2744308 RepID=UPI00385A10A0
MCPCGRCRYATASKKLLSLLPLLEGSAAEVREDFLIEYYSDTVFPRIQNMGYQALRTRQYKYIRYTELDAMDELYDLKADPQELDNLLPGNAQRGLAEKLAARIESLLTP